MNFLWQEVEITKNVTLSRGGRVTKQYDLLIDGVKCKELEIYETTYENSILYTCLVSEKLKKHGRLPDVKYDLNALKLKAEQEVMKWV